MSALPELRETYPDTELDWLVTEDALPIIETTPWIDKKWGLPNKKGYRLGKHFDLLRALQREKFDLSVDFVSNDR